MRLFNPILAREVNQLESKNVWSVAFQLDISGAPAPYRVVNYDQPITFHALEFLPMPLTVDSLEEATSSSLVSLRVTIENVSQELQSLLELYWASVPDPDWRVSLWQIDCTQPDLTPFSSGEIFTVTSVPTDLITAVPDLMAEGITLSKTVPGRRYTTSSGYPAIPRR